MPAKGSGVTNLRTLKERCTTRSAHAPECWLWKWSTRGGGQAAIHVVIDGRNKIVSGPWAALHFGGETPAPAVRTWALCGNKLCCNPKHAMSGSYAEHGKWKRETGALTGSPALVFAATKAGRARSAINMEIARAIRASDRSSTQEAQAWTEQLGRTVSLDVVSDVRLGKSWREPNPFSGLLASSDSRRSAA